MGRVAGYKKEKEKASFKVAGSQAGWGSCKLSVPDDCPISLKEPVGGAMGPLVKFAIQFVKCSPFYGKKCKDEPPPLYLIYLPLGCSAVNVQRAGPGMQNPHISPSYLHSASRTDQSDYDWSSLSQNITLISNPGGTDSLVSLEVSTKGN